MNNNRSSSQFNRRQFLAQSGGAFSVAAAVGLGRGTEAAPTAVGPATVAGNYDRGLPSNCQGAGVDPAEWVLFAFDDHWIPLRHQLELTLEQPQLYDKNPVLPLGGEGEPDHFFAALYGTVLRLDGKFRMWYSAVDNWEEFDPGRTNLRLAYAESEDGIHWVKPKLGLREYRGSRANNLLSLEREAYTPLVLYEPDEPDPEKRFKMTFDGYNHPGLSLSRSPRLCVAFSPDGLRWKEHPDNPVMRSTWSETSGLYRWNGIYYVNGQTGWPPGNARRTMITFASADMLTWEQAGVISFYRHPLNKTSGVHVGPQVHLGASVWHRRNVLLGFYGQWEGASSNRRPDVRMNLGLIISNDGLLFREPLPGFPFIPWGKEKSGWQTLRLLQGNAFVNHGDKTYIWYGGATDPTGKSEAVENRAMVGLATFPRDRFGYLRPTAPEAVWISNTLPAVPTGARLAINAEGLEENARLRIELLDYKFRPMARYSGENAAKVKQSGLRQTVLWPDGKARVPLREPWRVRARFEGKAAREIRFYALYV